MKEKTIDRKKIGKQNLEKGRRFELSVRRDLEDKGWIVSRWQNNVYSQECKNVKSSLKMDAGQSNEQSFILGPAKQGRFRKTSTGFPDFIAFRLHEITVTDTNTSVKFRIDNRDHYFVKGVECKTNGYLSKEEKEKCKWLLENNIFNEIEIASKGKKRGSIDYKEFKK